MELFLNIGKIGLAIQGDKDYWMTAKVLQKSKWNAALHADDCWQINPSNKSEENPDEGNEEDDIVSLLISTMWEEEYASLDGLHICVNISSPLPFGRC